MLLLCNFGRRVVCRGNSSSPFQFYSKFSKNKKQFEKEYSCHAGENQKSWKKMIVVQHKHITGAILVLRCASKNKEVDVKLEQNREVSKAEQSYN